AAPFANRHTAHTLDDRQQPYPAAPTLLCSAVASQRLPLSPANSSPVAVVQESRSKLRQRRRHPFAVRTSPWNPIYVAFQARSGSAPAGPSGSSRAGPSGSSPATHVLVSSPTMSQVEEDYVDNNSDENDETYVDVEPDEE
ncbi:unnamed protein product, partial [Linum tenue]